MKIQTAKGKQSIVLLLLSFLLFLTGCEKAPIREDVEGYWQLKRVTYLETGETVEYNGLYYGITRMLVKVSDPYNRYGCGQAFGRLAYQDDNNALWFGDFYVGAGNVDTGEPASVDNLIPYGINSRDEIMFRIVRCNGKTMTLESDYSRLELKKF